MAETALVVQILMLIYIVYVVENHLCDIINELRKTRRKLLEIASRCEDEANQEHKQ